MKAVSKSVSLPESLWVAIESRAPHTSGRDRSGYICNLVENDLRSAGLLDDSAALYAELLATARELGIPAALETLRGKLRRTGAGGKKVAA